MLPDLWITRYVVTAERCKFRKCALLTIPVLHFQQTTECLQSHMIRHGLDYRSSCRCCLKQFPADIYVSFLIECFDLLNHAPLFQQTIGIEHIREEHCFVNSESKQVVCKLCGQTGMTDEQFADHCRKSHLVSFRLRPFFLHFYRTVDLFSLISVKHPCEILT